MDEGSAFDLDAVGDAACIDGGPEGAAVAVSGIRGHQWRPQPVLTLALRDPGLAAPLPCRLDIDSDTSGVRPVRRPRGAFVNRLRCLALAFTATDPALTVPHDSGGPLRNWQLHQPSSRP
nr:hypothetical protein GCM10020063_027490 [Dactylosporangium thailandense]